MNIFWFLKPKVTYQSKINGKITIGLREGNKALFSGNVTQSGGEIKPMWDEVMADFYKRNLNQKKFLILELVVDLSFTQFDTMTKMPIS
jgi:hypothetical protein